MENGNKEYRRPLLERASPSTSKTYSPNRRGPRILNTLVDTFTFLILLLEQHLLYQAEASAACHFLDKQRPCLPNPSWRTYLGVPLAR